jgi:hypothetical protein
MTNVQISDNSIAELSQLLNDVYPSTLGNTPSVTTNAFIMLMEHETLNMHTPIGLLKGSLSKLYVRLSMIQSAIGDVEFPFKKELIKKPIDLYFEEDFNNMHDKDIQPILNEFMKTFDEILLKVKTNLEADLKTALKNAPDMVNTINKNINVIELALRVQQQHKEHMIDSSIENNILMHEHCRLYIIHIVLDGIDFKHKKELVDDRIEFILTSNTRTIKN